MVGSKPASGSSAAPARQPSLWVPLRYFVTAQAAFVTALLWAPWQVDNLLDFYYQGNGLALTHLLTLGWITMTVMGASFQLVPVALETTLWSERLAGWQYWIMLLGVALMVSHFWIGHHHGVAIGAGLVLIAITLFLINMGRTLWQLPRWDIIGRHVAAALVYLASTVVMGNLMALDKMFDFLGGQVLRTIHAHAHLAGIGWVTMMVFGASYKLIPMFSLSELRNERPAYWEFWLLNVGLVGLYPTLLMESVWATLFAILIAAAVGLFLWNMREVLRTRRRPRLDWGLRHSFSAMITLVPLTILGLWLATGWVSSDEFAARLPRLWGPGASGLDFRNDYRYDVQDYPIPGLAPPLQRPRRASAGSGRHPAPWRVNASVGVLAAPRGHRDDRGRSDLHLRAARPGGDPRVGCGWSRVRRRRMPDLSPLGSPSDATS